MNREQADKIISVISKDATGRGRYFPTDSTECVLGSLWLSMGGTRSIVNPKALCDFYGIDGLNPKGYFHNQWVDLYETNDAFYNTRDRRAALIRVVESWVL